MGVKSIMAKEAMQFPDGREGDFIIKFRPSKRDRKRRRNKAMAELNKAKTEIKFVVMPRPCRHCGNCCRVFGIGLCDEDLEREPRLKELAVPVAELPQKTQPTFLKRLGEKYCIRKEEKPCPFLYEDKGKYFCSIYETRPNACRRFMSTLLHCKIAALKVQGFDLNLNMKQWTIEGIPVPRQIATIMCIDPERLKQFKGKAFADEDIYYQNIHEFSESIDLAIKDGLNNVKPK